MKKLKLITIVALFMGLVASSTLWLAGGAAATVPANKVISIPLGSWAHEPGTDLECRAVTTVGGKPAFFCYLYVLKGSKVDAQVDRYAVVISDSGVVVDKTNAAGTGFSSTKVYKNG